MRTNPKFLSATRWLARVLALGIFLLWGAFFVEHVQEWFIAPFPKHPPLKVCAIMGLHGLMLAGLLALWRWELAGSLLVLAAAGAFFFAVAGKSALLFFGVTALPALLSLWCWWHRHHAIGPSAETPTR